MVGWGRNSGRELSGVSSYKGSNPMTSLNPNDLPKAPSPNITTSGVRNLAYEILGVVGAHKHSVHTGKLSRE